jgi:predicted TIM-barrel fold metal-dependent hydrolase
MDKPFPKINMFTHLLPDKYRKTLYRKAKRNIYTEDLESHHDGQPTLYDMEQRFKLLEKFEGFREVITLLTPPIEWVADPGDAKDLAMLGNDEVAGLVAKYPDHFVAGVASLPMNDMDNAMREAQRAVEELGMKGIQLYTPCYEKPLDTPEFFPLYEMMMNYDLPIWIHPLREANVPEYKGETTSKYRIYQTVGWPYETTIAAARLVFSGVMERYPSLKFIIHHCGGMVPFFAGRLAGVGAQILMDHAGVEVHLSRPTIDYFRMFYADTALSGYSTPSLMAAYAFFGADHMVFATDLMLAVEKKLASTDQMIIPDEDKYKICEGNARKLLHL